VTGQSSIEIEIHSPTSCFVTLHGEHDVASREAVTMALALTRDYTSVLVDLTSCTFIDATVTNTLLAAAARLRHGGRSLELIVPTESHPIRRLFGAAGILPLVPLHATRDRGLAAIESQERLDAHRRVRDLRAVAARIARHSHSTEAGRSARCAKARGGTTVLRAHIADEGDLNEASPRITRGTGQPGTPENWGQRAA
jgi:anti-anti-sigma factor